MSSVIMNDNNLDLTEIPMLDNHCFMFAEKTKSLSISDFEQYYLPGGPTAMGLSYNEGSATSSFLMKSSVAFPNFVKELGKYFDCDPDIDSIIKIRNTQSEDYREYLRNLFGDVNLDWLLTDTGNIKVEDLQNSFLNWIPIKGRAILRLETAIKQLLEETKTFSEFINSYDQVIKDAIRKKGCVSFKSVIAYRTGLEIENVGEEDAKQDFNRYLNKEEKIEWYGPVVKKLRDYLFTYTLRRCAELNVALNVHTGIGDTDIVASKCNPINLTNILKDEENRKAKVVIIHGGFPYTMEACWLANVLPNVYIELSPPMPPYFAPAVSAKRYREIIEFTPGPKIIYGSDAGSFPETHWLIAKTAKKSTARALSDLIVDEAINENEAYHLARIIFSENAKRLHNL